MKQVKKSANKLNFGHFDTALRVIHEWNMFCPKLIERKLKNK